jgi:hypothetical protein
MPRPESRLSLLHAALLSFDGAGVNKLGPSLAGIVGSKSGAVPGYNFSPALKASNITWDEQTLDKFLENPSADVHGTKMIVSVPASDLAVSAAIAGIGIVSHFEDWLRPYLDSGALEPVPTTKGPVGSNARSRSAGIAREMLPSQVTRGGDRGH